MTLTVTLRSDNQKMLTFEALEMLCRGQYWIGTQSINGVFLEINTYDEAQFGVMILDPTEISRGIYLMLEEELSAVTLIMPTPSATNDVTLLLSLIERIADHFGTAQFETGNGSISLSNLNERAEFLYKNSRDMLSMMLNQATSESIDIINVPGARTPVDIKVSEILTDNPITTQDAFDERLHAIQNHPADYPIPQFHNKDDDSTLIGIIPVYENRETILPLVPPRPYWLADHFSIVDWVVLFVNHDATQRYGMFSFESVKTALSLEELPHYDAKNVIAPALNKSELAELYGQCERVTLP